jgi:hypothetical protein
MCLPGIIIITLELNFTEPFRDMKYELFVIWMNHARANTFYYFHIRNAIHRCYVSKRILSVFRCLLKLKLRCLLNEVNLGTYIFVYFNIIQYPLNIFILPNKLFRINHKGNGRCLKISEQEIYIKLGILNFSINLK